MKYEEKEGNRERKSTKIKSEIFRTILCMLNTLAKKTFLKVYTTHLVECLNTD